MRLKLSGFIKSILFTGILVCTAMGRPSDDSLKALENIVVTGTKTEKALARTPVRTEVVTREDIERYNASNLYQILDRVPGIRMELQCNNCNFGLMRMGGLEGGYARVLIDGQPVYSGLAGVYGMQQIQAGLIERIEIVKGAGSALYGSDAIAGVVNVITRRPTPEPSMEIGGSIGVNPIDDQNRSGNPPIMSNVNFAASHRKGNFAARVAGQSNTTDEIDNNGDMATDRINSKNLGGTTKLSWYDAMGDKSTVDVMGRAIYENRKGGSIDKDADGNYFIDNALSPEGPGSEHIITERFEGGLTIEKELSSQTLIKAVANAVSHYRSATNGAAWEKLEGKNFSYSPFTLDDASEVAGLSPQPFLTKERTVVGEVNVAQPVKKNNTVLAGVQVKRTDVEENINGAGWVKRYFQDVGIFLQDEWDIVERLGFVAGVRYDMHRSEDYSVKSDYDESAINPRVSLRFTPFDELITRLSWGTGFRVPGDFSEDTHLCASAPKIQKSSKLDPERSMSFGLSADFKKNRLSTSISLFRTNIEDKVFLAEYSGSDNAFDLEWANAEGSACSQGFELGAGYELDFMELDGSYVFDYAQYEDEQIPGNEKSKNITRSPRHTGNINLAFLSDPDGESFVDGWRLDLGVKVVGSMFIERDGGVVEEYAEKGVLLNTIVETDPYALLDMKINKDINKVGLSIYLAAENLLNVVQERKQYDIDDAAMVFAPLYGTTVSIGFKKQF